MVNLANYRGVIAKMYKDRFDVYRHGTETDANGATHQVCYQIPALSNQPLYLDSLSSRTRSYQWRLYHCQKDEKRCSGSDI